MNDQNEHESDARTREELARAAVEQARELLAATPYEPVGSEAQAFDARTRAWREDGIG